jgi:glycosyltransferase involved in cell wall biosynthesis
VTQEPRSIVLVGPPWYPIPPDGYGGTELIVALLAAELRARGHNVVVLALEGSRNAVGLAPAPWAEDLGRPTERLRELTYAARLHRFLGVHEGVDLLHDHCGHASLLVASLGGGAPVLHTVHGALGEPEQTFYESLGDSLRLVAISEAQRATAQRLPWAGTVPNAVDLDALTVARAADREPYLLCLARISEDKGQDLAIEVAHHTGMRLVLAGKVAEDARSQELYQERVRPHVDGERIVHLENVAGGEKARLLARATALLSPIRWPEPFGLSMAEAMCSGTPAIAFRRGAAPELIVPAVTGFVVDDLDGMCEAVRQASEIDPRRCAREARSRFSPAAMAEGYLAVYERLLGPRPGGVPEGQSSTDTHGAGPAITSSPPRPRTSTSSRQPPSRRRRASTAMRRSPTRTFSMRSSGHHGGSAGST